MKKENSISRRSFLKSTAMAGALGAIGTGSASVLTSCAGGGESAAANKPLKEPGTYYIPELPDKATDGKELKAGVIGCGGRGSGAAENFLDAANGVTVVAVADTFKERVDALADKLKEKGCNIPEDKRFVGLDAYKQLIDSGVDVVIIATPPVFRPVHFQYAVEKGKHCFLEKPICVDPVGYRTIMATAKQAQAKNLCVVTGTQRHHQRNYVESYKKIMEGAIGEITGGVVYWNQSMLWFRERQKDWNDCEYMIKDWVNWKWLSGDHIVEQHVHNIDVFTWFSGLKPVKAVGFGSRQRRATSMITSASISQWKTASTCIVCAARLMVVPLTSANLSKEQKVLGTVLKWKSRTMQVTSSGNTMVKQKRTHIHRQIHMYWNM